MTVKLEHAGITVELIPEILNNSPAIYLIINSKLIGYVSDDRRVHIDFLV